MLPVPRPDAARRIEQGLRRYPVTALLGPRQCGKTTLAREIARTRRGTYLDLENPRDLGRLANPQMVLEGLGGIVVLDEIHRRPDLLPLLRVLADRDPPPCRFLVLGSFSPEIIRGASETLAGRVHFVHLTGFTLEEAKGLPSLWLRGGFPRSFLARSERASFEWRENFVRTFLERDLPLLGVRTPFPLLHRFWTMLAHYHGQVWTGAEIAGSLGLSQPTVRTYLDLLTGAYLMRQLPPWFENVGKRVVKSPKVYLRDPGLLHALLGIRLESDLQAHPKFGASWEGFALEQVLAEAGDHDAYFWATHAGAELDLLLVRGPRRYGLEFKCSDAPALTKTMRVVLEDLKLDRLFVVYPGRQTYPLDPKVECRGIEDPSWLRKLRG